MSLDSSMLYTYRSDSCFSNRSVHLVSSTLFILSKADEIHISNHQCSDDLLSALHAGAGLPGRVLLRGR